MTTVYSSFYIHILDRKQSQRNHKHQKTSNLVGTEEKSFQFLVHTFMKRENLYCIQQKKKYMFLTFKFFLPMCTLSLLSRQFSLSCFQTFFSFLFLLFTPYLFLFICYICLQLSLSFFLCDPAVQEAGSPLTHQDPLHLGGNAPGKPYGVQVMLASCLRVTLSAVRVT